MTLDPRRRKQPYSASGSRMATRESVPLPEVKPHIFFDAEQVCNICREFEQRERVPLGLESDFIRILDKKRGKHHGKRSEHRMKKHGEKAAVKKPLQPVQPIQPDQKG